MDCFTLRASGQELADEFALARTLTSELGDCFRPQQSVLAIRLAQDDGQREVVKLKWGLIPAWARDAACWSSTHNARDDCLATWCAFQEPFRHQRCLILADGYFVGSADDLHCVQMENEALFAFAGLWDRWRGPEGQVESCTVITTDADAQHLPYSRHMPVIVSKSDYAAWICPHQESSILQSLLQHFTVSRPPLNFVEQVNTTAQFV